MNREEFIDILNYEFFQQTGRGMYAYITPVTACQIFSDFKNADESIDNFIQHRVRSISDNSDAILIS